MSLDIFKVFKKADVRSLMMKLHNRADQEEEGFKAGKGLEESRREGYRSSCVSIK